MKKLAWLLPLLLPLSAPAWPADDLITSQMADEARMWQQKDRDDLAADVWRRLLRTQPRHPEALVRLGMIEARNGNLRQAEALRARARALSPAPAGLQELDAALQAASGAPGEPAAKAAPKSVQADAAPAPSREPAPAARQTARSDAAAATAAPSTRPAAGASAAEPARPTLAELQAATASGKNWAGTRRKIEQLLQQHPSDSAYKLALARHLLARGSTRREGLRQLAALPPELRRSGDTRKLWRENLLALDDRAGDAALLSAYLNDFPDDAAVASRLRMLPAASAVAAPVAGPAASAPAPARGRNEAGLLLEAALADERAGAFGAAARKLERGMLLDPANPALRIALARQYSHMGALENAAGILDALLVAEPDSADALQARAELFVAQEQWMDGLNMLERIPKGMRTPRLARTQQRLWAGAQAERARALFRRGEGGQSALLLEQVEALGRNDDLILRLAAAGWGDAGEVARGLRLIREALSRASGPVAGLQIRYAWLLLQAGQDTELSSVLRDLSTPGRLNAAQQQGLNRVIFAYTLRLAESLSASGRAAEAASMLAPLLERTGDPRAFALMARIHRQNADAQRGLQAAEAAVERAPDDVGLRLLASELAIAAREFDKAEEHAKAAAAILPNHPRVISALGRAERFQGNIEQALRLFEQAHGLEYDPASFQAGPPHLRLRLVSHERVPGAPVPQLRPANPGLLPIPDVSLRGVPHGAPVQRRTPAAAVAPAVEPPPLVLAATRPAPPAPAAPTLSAAAPAASQSAAEIRVPQPALRFDWHIAGAPAPQRARDFRLSDPAFMAVHGTQEAGADEGVRLKLALSLASSGAGGKGKTL